MAPQGSGRGLHVDPPSDVASTVSCPTAQPCSASVKSTSSSTAGPLYCLAHACPPSLVARMVRAPTTHPCRAETNWMATSGAIVPGRYEPAYANAVVGTPVQSGADAAGGGVADAEVPAGVAAAVAVAPGCPPVSGVPVDAADAGLPGVGAPHATASSMLTPARTGTMTARLMGFMPVRTMLPGAWLPGARDGTPGG